jgi:hypothetical protein
MNAPKPKYANFPERDLKVVIGPHINAATMKALGKLSIGTYEMSVAQQERGQATRECARLAMNHLAREIGLTVTAEETRDYLCCFVGVNDKNKFKLWITPPFESGQANHLVWVQYNELEGDKKVCVAYKLATSFTSEDILNVLKNAQKNAIVLPEGEPFELKGNPPPRFAKKNAAEAKPAAEPKEKENT